MATVGQHISDFRTLLKEYGDDTPYTPQTLYRILTSAKAKLLQQRKRVTAFNWQAFCIGLEKVKSHDCDCVAVGCDVLRTKHPIPRALTVDGREMIKVFDFDDDVIPYRSETRIKADASDDIKGGKVVYSVRNNHLYIWNNLKLKAIIVSGIWSDLSEWQDIELCDEDGNAVGVCYSIDTDDFGIEENLSYDMYTMAYNLLNPSTQRFSDMNNDSNPEIRQ